MLFASYYVVEYLLSIFENNKGIDEWFEVFEKLAHRYSKDAEFNGIYEKFRSSVSQKNSTELEGLKEDLKRLRDSRRLMINYAITTPFRP